MISHHVLDFLLVRTPGAPAHARPLACRDADACFDDLSGMDLLLLPTLIARLLEDLLHST